MKKVFIICSDFPPLRTGGTIRCEKQAKYLPLFGWETVVFTRKPQKGAFLDNHYKLDHCKICRTDRCDIVLFLSKAKSFIMKYIYNINRGYKIEKKKPSNYNQPRKRLPSEYIFIPDKDILWALMSLIKAICIFQREKPSVIYSSSPSHSVHIIGLILKYVFKKKWIVEFRDPWTFNPFSMPHPINFLNRLNEILERICVKNADIIVVTSEEYKKEFKNKYDFLCDSKIVFNPNGYDPADFEKLSSLKDKNKIVFSHIGNFYQNRSSVNLVAAFINIFKKDAKLINNIQVRFIGSVDNEGMNLICNSNFKESFALMGNKSHEEALQEMVNANYLLLIPGPGEGTMPGKIYEYLAAENPILCIANEGPTIDFIKSNNLGLVSADNIEMIEKGIIDLMNKKWDVDDKTPVLLKKYSRKTIAQNTSYLLTELIK